MAVVYEWPTEAGRSDTIRSDLGWRAAELGTPSPPSRDLLRVVTAAHNADRAGAATGSAPHAHPRSAAEARSGTRSWVKMLVRDLQSGARAGIA
jgi:hypothetical protein